MIDRNHKLSITRQAKLLDISRGTVTYLPQPVSPADLALMRKLDELHQQVARALRKGVSQPDGSRLFSGQFRDMSVERLMRMLTRLGGGGTSTCRQD